MEYSNANKTTPEQQAVARNNFITQYERNENGGAFDQDFTTFHDCFTGSNPYCSVDKKSLIFDKVETVVQHRPQPLMVWASNFQLMMQQSLIAECGYETSVHIRNNLTDLNCTAANNDMALTQSLAAKMKDPF